MLNSPKSQRSFDEYQGLSYQRSALTPIVYVDLAEQGDADSANLLNTSTNASGINQPSNKKKSMDDYKKKYKTEKCKFYEVNKECKYGDNVSFINNLFYHS